MDLIKEVRASRNGLERTLPTTTTKDSAKESARRDGRLAMLTSLKAIDLTSDEPLQRGLLDDYILSKSKQLQKL